MRPGVGSDERVWSLEGSKSAHPATQAWPPRKVASVRLLAPEMFTVPASQSAAALLRSSIAAPRFSSGSAAIDDLFTPASHPSSPSSSQGLAHGAVLELMGPPGIGKTRAALGFILAARFDALGDTAAEEVLVVGELRSRLLGKEGQLTRQDLFRYGRIAIT